MLTCGALNAAAEGDPKRGKKVFNKCKVCHMVGEKAKKQSFKIFTDIYRAGIDVIESVGRDSLKSQLKQAEKKKVLYTLILGQKEAVDGTIIVRDMVTGVQEVIAQDKMIEYLREGLKQKEEEEKEKEKEEEKELGVKSEEKGKKGKGEKK